MFNEADAAVLRAVLLRERPRRVVEVGSGHSTALMLDVVDEALPETRLTSIEPYPARLRSRLRDGDSARLEIIEKPVQDVPITLFEERLGAGDLLFIDSTHVSKAASDVNYLFLDVLPRLPVGALVHIHDIFWPFEYPQSWLDDGRYWNENYLLHAFLLHNHEWEVLLLSSWVWKEHRERVPAALQGHEPGSVWLRRKRP